MHTHKGSGHSMPNVALQQNVGKCPNTFQCREVLPMPSMPKTSLPTAVQLWLFKQLMERARQAASGCLHTSMAC